jgi:putative transposase
MVGEGHAVESVCRVLTSQGCQIAARTYRAWRTTGPSRREVTQAQLIDAIREVAWTVDEHGPLAGVRRLTPEGLYGRRKMAALLRRRGVFAAESAVAGAMRTLGLEGVRRAKSHRTTTRAKDGAGDRASDLLNRDFTAPAPNRVWISDFTYVRTWAGFAYVAFVVDVYAQRIVAWHAATTKTTELVMTPLRMALWDRDRTGRPTVSGELIWHSDAGSQYTAVRFTERLALEGIAPSIGTVGDALDNALMETLIGLYKTECIRTTVFHAGAFKTLADVEYATAGWTDWWNNRRLHSTLGMLTPDEHEQAHYAALDPEVSPT